MKKYLLLILALFPLSTFADVSTDVVLDCWHIQNNAPYSVVLQTQQDGLWVDPPYKDPVLPGQIIYFYDPSVLNYNPRVYESGNGGNNLNMFIMDCRNGFRASNPQWYTTMMANSGSTNTTDTGSLNPLFITSHSLSYHVFAFSLDWINFFAGNIVWLLFLLFGLATVGLFLSGFFYHKYHR